MRILHILDHSAPLHSGYVFRTLSILRQQRALGWSTAHVTGAKQSAHGADPGAPEQMVDGWHFYRTAPHPAWWARLPLLGQIGVIAGLARRLRQIVEQDRPDILHAHSPALNAIAALWVGRRLALPVVYEVRAFWEDAAADHGSGRTGGLRYRLTRALESYALRRVDAVTTICHGLRDDIAARGIAAERITVIPNAVDPSDFAPPAGPSDAATKLEPALAARLGSGPVIGFIGSFYAYEGLALLLRAMPAMLAAQPTLRLLLVGGGPQQAQLQALAGELALEQAVIFTGRVPHPAVASYYQRIDILVYPRLPMRLTELVTPLKPLEAMAQGRLVVASNVGGHRELITHGRTGILFKAGDAAALSQAVLRLLADPSLWPALRHAGRHYVAKERNWAASVAGYGAVYQRALARRPAALARQPA
ncbi:MAG: TIGR04063 family PEP-CTERM/XrtA system glycosyltransferase [Pseudomonadota bacterium]